MSVEGLIEQVYRERYLGFRNALAPIVGSREVAHDVVQEAWNDVVARVGTRRPIRHRARLALVAALVLIAIALPTLALSASVRELLGLSHPGPDYKHARLAVSAPIPGGRVARVWVSPSTDGGRCQFVTIDPAGSAHLPTQMTGGGACTLGRAPLQRLVTWSFSRSRHTAAVIDGRVDAKLHATSVELRWRGGAQRLELNDGFFVASAPTLDDPPFARLPYDVVVSDATGRIVARSRIPTSFLYANWKRVQPQLHRYRVAHGCSTVDIWRCKTR